MRYEIKNGTVVESMFIDATYDTRSDAESALKEYTITKSMAIKALKTGQAVYANFHEDAVFNNVNAPVFERMRIVSIGPKYVTTMTANGKVDVSKVKSFDLG